MSLDNVVEPEKPEGGRDAAVLEGTLSRYPGATFRKAYLANLLASGKRFQVAGNARGAEYCFAKVEAALQEFASILDDEDVTASPSAPRVRAKAKDRPLSATERVRRQWRLERIKDAETVLVMHGSRLSALENQTYREKLEKLRHSGTAAASPSQSDKADSGLLDLRRRLYSRVLKSQKISLKRQRMPVTLGRLALPPSTPGSARLPVPSGPAVRVDTARQPVIGPYNDRFNMEDLLSLIANADAAWVEEFLDLYRGLAGLEGLMASLTPKK
ncbi:MAG: hypothetical protein M3Y08_12145 [Fibrobacterota bacterium]|nr:hypothetical protein [Fibrobacterota bacterium]